jgi:hypothetical protein
MRFPNSVSFRVLAVLLRMPDVVKPLPPVAGDPWKRTRAVLKVGAPRSESPKVAFLDDG